MVVPLSCDNKAISAPSWGLAGWLGVEFGNYGLTLYEYNTTLSMSMKVVTLLISEHMLETPPYPWQLLPEVGL